jgi:hypothetical protein
MFETDDLALSCRNQRVLDRLKLKKKKTEMSFKWAKINI